MNIQKRDFEWHKTFIRNFEDDCLEVSYYDWCHMNECDINLTYTESRKMTARERLELRNCNPEVREYYDK